MRILTISLMLALASMPGWAQAGQAAIAKAEAAAYAQITKGEVWEGTIALIDLLRAVPGDDPALADSMTGPAQLLGFSIAFLLNWDQRNALEDEYLDPKAYITDQLLVAGVKVASGLGRDKWLQALHDFMIIADGEHQAARVGAMCFLADPYYFHDLQSLQRHTAELYLHYGDRAVARNLLRQRLCNTVNEQSKKPQANKTIFSEMVYAGGRAEPIRAVDPVIARVTDGLPSFNLREAGEAAPQRWATLAKTDANDEVRYLSLRLLASSDETPERMNQAREAAREAGARKEDTRDAALARGMALEYARKALDFDEMGQWAGRLLGQGPLPGEPERCLYEWEMRATQHAAETYARYGYHQEAQRLYRGLAAKYPNSELAERCLQQAADIAEDPLGVSLNLIQREARHRFQRKEFEKSAAFYRDVAARTPHASLAAACEVEAKRIIVRAGARDE